MKIAVRGGHCPKVPGARAMLDELIEDRLVKNALVKRLMQIGYEVLDVTPPDSTSTSSADLAYGVNKANEWGADLFVSIHFNKAYDSYNGALGSEVCIYSENDIAQRVVNGLGELGFKNRGQKIRTNLYELKHTKMKAMIVETCFVEATEDVALYKRLGADAVGKKIAEAIANKKVPTQQPTEQVTEQYKVEYEAHVENVGWQGVKHDGETAGTVGESKRLEALRINCQGIKFKGHIQNIGWTSERLSGEVVGTAGEDLRLEAVQIFKDGIKYRVHIQNKGWTDWKSSGEVAGTVGESLRIEAIEIKF